MADKRVDELADIDALAGADSFPVRDASATTELKEVTATQIATFIDAAGAAASAVSTHEAAANPHPTYLTAAEGDAAYDAIGAAAAAQAAAVQRANHTGTQAASTISDFATAADARIAAASIDDLSDVTITTPSSGQVLKWNGGAWVNDTDATAGGTTDLADIGDVTITTVADNEVLAYNSGTSTWINQTASEAGLATASDLTAHTGDTSAAHAVTNIGASTNNIIAGRVTAGAGDLEELTASQVRTLIDVDPSGTDNSTDVTLAGTPDYITISGQTITRGLIDLAADVTGDLPVTEGGTGASDASGARTNLGLVIGTDVAAPSATWTWRAVDTKSGSAYTIVAGDAGKLIVMSTAHDVVIPDSLGLAAGTQFGILLTGASGNITDGASVTLNGETTGAASLAMTPHQIIVVTTLSTDTYNVSGV